jgi:hypothetical protein
MREICLSGSRGRTEWRSGHSVLYSTGNHCTESAEIGAPQPGQLSIRACIGGIISATAPEYVGRLRHSHSTSVGTWSWAARAGQEPSRSTMMVRETISGRPSITSTTMRCGHPPHEYMGPFLGPDSAPRNWLDMKWEEECVRTGSRLSCRSGLILVEKLADNGV